METPSRVCTENAPSLKSIWLRGDEVEVSGLVWWTTAEGRGHPNPGFGLRLLDPTDAYTKLLDDLRGKSGRR